MKRVCEVQRIGVPLSGDFRARVIYQNGAEFEFELDGRPLLATAAKAANAALEVSAILMNAIIVRERAEMVVRDDPKWFFSEELMKVSSDLAAFISAGPKDWDGFRVVGGAMPAKEFASCGQLIKHHKNSIREVSPARALRMVISITQDFKFRHYLMKGERIGKDQGGDSARYCGLNEALRASSMIGKGFMITPPSPKALERLALNQPEEPAEISKPASPAQTRAERRLAFQEQNVGKIREELLPKLSVPQRREVEERLRRVEEHIASVRRERQEFDVLREVEASLYALEVQSGAGPVSTPISRTSHDSRDAADSIADVLRDIGESAQREAEAAAANVQRRMITSGVSNAVKRAAAGASANPADIRPQEGNDRFLVQATQASRMLADSRAGKVIEVGGEPLVLKGSGQVFEASAKMANAFPWVSKGDTVCYVYFDRPEPESEERPEY